MTYRHKAGVHQFPIKRGILSTLPRVNADMSLDSFYNAIATHFDGGLFTLDEFLNDWNQIVVQQLGNNPRWYDYVTANFSVYVRALIWLKNPQFAQIVISRYIPPDASMETREIDVIEEAPVGVDGEESSETAGETVTSDDEGEEVAAAPVPGLPDLPPIPSLPDLPLPLPGGFEAPGSQVDENDSLEPAKVDVLAFRDNDIDVDVETITSETYAELMDEVAAMKLSELRDFADVYGVPLGNATRKQDIKDRISSALKARIVD